jgi:hypothetical protein
MAERYELLGSGDFSAGPTSITGKFLFLIDGAGDQDEAYQNALAGCPAQVNGIPRGSVSITQLSPTLYHAEVEYASDVRPEGPSGAGDSPPQGGDGQGGGNVAPGGQDGRPPVEATQELGSEMSFNSGGSTERIYTSIATRHAVAAKANKNAAAKAAPRFGRMIGVSKRGIEGCEVYSASATFTISQRFKKLTVGYMMRMLSMVATTNEAPFRGADKGEVLFMGSDGGFKSGDDLPWSIAGKFGYSPNRKKVVIRDDADGYIELPDVEGWNYIWNVYEETTITVDNVKYQVERPKFSYVEQVYEESDFSVLKMD